MANNNFTIVTKGNGDIVVPADTTVINKSDINILGDGVVNYAKPIAESMVWHLENFANGTEPDYPLIGQLWYDTNENVLKIRNEASTWTTIASEGYADTGDTLVWKLIDDADGPGPGPGPSPAPYPAAVGENLLVDTSNAEVFIKLPAIPNANDKIRIAPAGPTYSVNSVTVMRNGKKIAGGSIDILLDQDGTSIELVYIDAGYGWAVFNRGESVYINETTTTDALSKSGGTMTGALILDDAQMSDPNNLRAVTYAYSNDTYLKKTATSQNINGDIIFASGKLTLAANQMTDATNSYAATKKYVDDKFTDIVNGTSFTGPMILTSNQMSGSNQLLAVTRKHLLDNYIYCVKTPVLYSGGIFTVDFPPTSGMPSVVLTDDMIIEFSPKHPTVQSDVYAKISINGGTACPIKSAITNDAQKTTELITTGTNTPVRFTYRGGIWYTNNSIVPVITTKYGSYTTTSTDSSTVVKWEKTFKNGTLVKVTATGVTTGSGELTGIVYKHTIDITTLGIGDLAYSISHTTLGATQLSATDNVSISTFNILNATSIFNPYHWTLNWINA